MEYHTVFARRTRFRLFLLNIVLFAKNQFFKVTTVNIIQLHDLDGDFSLAERFKAMINIIVT